MQKIVFTIVSNQVVADKTYRLELSCSQDIAMTPGQFVNIAIDGKYLRRPISVSDVTRNSLLLYYKTVGEGTKIMSEMAAGQQLELLTELGTGFDADKCKQSALLVGGGLGSAPLYMLCKKLLGIAGFTIGSIHIARLDVVENVCPQHSNRTQSCFCGFHLFVELVDLIHLILYRCAKQIILEEVVVFQIVFQHLLLLGIETTGVNHDGFARLVGEDIAVHREHIEFKFLYSH